MQIEQLNDDCLFNIFKYLNINDLFSIGVTCDRFRHVIKSFNQKYEFNINNIRHQHKLLTLLDSEVFLSTIGHHILLLNAPVQKAENPYQLFQIIQKYCTNLKHLRIEKWTNLDFSRLSILIKRLRSLELQKCQLPENMPSILMTTTNKTCHKPIFLEELTSLESLTLNKCSNIQSNSLEEFLAENNQLKHLKLLGQKEIFNANGIYVKPLEQSFQYLNYISLDSYTTKNIDLNILAKLPELKQLQLIDYNIDYSFNINYLLIKLIETDRLEELDLHFCQLSNETYKTISKFTNLKILKMNKNFWINDNNLQQMHLRSKLKQFHCFDCVRIGDEGIIQFYKMNEHIEVMDLSWCFMLTDVAIRSIYDIFGSQVHRPNLEIIANGRTKITPLMFKVWRILSVPVNSMSSAKRHTKK